MSANVATIDVGIASAEMIVERKFHKNTNTTAAANNAPNQVFVDAVERRPDEHRLVADDFGSDAGRQQRRDFREPLLDAVGNCHGIAAGLLDDEERDRRHAVQH